MLYMHAETLFASFLRRRSMWKCLLKRVTRQKIELARVDVEIASRFWPVRLDRALNKSVKPEQVVGRTEMHLNFTECSPCGMRGSFTAPALFNLRFDIGKSNIDANSYSDASAALDQFALYGLYAVV
jgi:hypothetical protein